MNDSTMIRLRTILLRIFVEPSVRRFLHTRMSPEKSDEALEAMWQRYAVEAPSVPRRQGFGPTLILHFAAITIAFHQTLIDAGYSDEAAAQLVIDVAWVVYRKMGAFMWQVSRLAARDRSDRIKVATGIFRRFPFSPGA